VGATSVSEKEAGINVGLLVEVSNGPEIVFGDKAYNLHNMHFHTPAEHIVEGSRADAEVQFFHMAADGSGNRMVVSVFLDSGEDANGPLERLIEESSSGRTEHTLDIHALSRQMLVGTMPNDPSLLSDFRPNFRSYYQYHGSLTTPPCTEDVTWLLLRNRVAIDARKMTLLRTLQGDNTRPVQALNGRKVHEVGSVEMSTLGKPMATSVQLTQQQPAAARSELQRQGSGSSLQKQQMGVERLRQVSLSKTRKAPILHAAAGHAVQLDAQTLNTPL